MKIDARALAALALSLSPVLWAADADKPGGKRICVPSEDGRTWVCGTPDAPPPERGLAGVRSNEPSPEPPMFLSNPDAGSSPPGVDSSAAAPERTPVDEFDGNGRAAPTMEPAPATADVAPIEEAAPLAPEPMPEPEPSAEAAPMVEEPAPSRPDIVGADSAQVGTPALLAAPTDDRGFPLQQVPDPGEPTPIESATPAPEPTPVVAEQPAAPEPVAEAPVEAEPTVAAAPPEPEPVAPEPEPVASEPEPVVAEPVVAEPVVTETIAAAPEAAPVVAAPLASAPRNSATFLAIAPGHYTLQLARASSQSGFTTLLGTLGLRGEEAFSVPLPAGGAASWLLLWGDFESLDAARAAAARLTPRVSAWPRRAAPIQDELRAAGAR